MIASARPSVPRLVGGLAAVCLASLALVGCVPESDETASTSTPAASPTEQSQTPTPTATAAADIELPTECAALYSDGMRQTLDETLPTENDPAVTLYSTQIVGALEVLESGIPTLRCTWTSPDGPGLATNVSIVDAEAASVISDALSASGFTCEDVEGGTECRIETETVDADANKVTQGEVQYLRDNGWITTAWIDTIPDGYTEDIVATLWG